MNEFKSILHVCYFLRVSGWNPRNFVTKIFATNLYFREFIWFPSFLLSHTHTLARRHTRIKCSNAFTQHFAKMLVYNSKCIHIYYKISWIAFIIPYIKQTETSREANGQNEINLKGETKTLIVRIKCQKQHHARKRKHTTINGDESFRPYQMASNERVLMLNSSHDYLFMHGNRLESGETASFGRMFMNFVKFYGISVE